MSQSLHHKITTGVEGLNLLLHGGLIAHRGYLLRGGPGAGKTTLGMHFLDAGIQHGEPGLFITLGESEADLKLNGRSMGFAVDQINYLDLSPNSDFFADAKNYDLFTTVELERDPITQKIVDKVRKIKPKRIFLDPTSHLRYLAIDAHQFRMQLLSFVRFLMEQGATVLFTSEGSSTMPDDDVVFLCDGVINLEQTARGRKIEITKFRGSDHQSGKHTFKLTNQGAKVYPKLIPSQHGQKISSSFLTSGIPEMDRLLHGGIERGTSTVITGPAGVGKSTLAMQFARTNAASGERTVIFSFEESIASMTFRAEAIGIPLNQMVDSGHLVIIPIEPLLFTADEFADQVRQEVECHDTRLVILDGIAGYKLSVLGEVEAELRSLFKYVTNMGVTMLAVNETEGITGDFKATEIGISYMADSIIFIRYLELRGELRKAMGILKKRLGDFERHMREFAITTDGILIGEPLTELRGILQGTPSWESEVTREKLIPQK